MTMTPPTRNGREAVATEPDRPSGNAFDVAAATPALLARLARDGVRLRLLPDERLEVVAPAGGMSTELRAELVRHKADLVRWLTSAGDIARDAEALPVIVPEPDRLHEPFTPSDLQISFLLGGREELEFHVRPHQYLELDFADLDPERFEAALNAELRRQRKSIVVVGDDLELRTVRDPAPLRVTIEDSRHLDEAHSAEVIARVREQMRRAELPLDRWPWMDVRLTRYGKDRVRLHYNNNNFFSDGPGTGRFLESVLRRYRDAGLVLPELEIGYRDCVLALAELERSPLGERSRTYWCDRMAAWPDAPAVPLVSGVETRTRARLSRREFVIDTATWDAFKQRASARGLTPTNALYGTYAEVVAQWSGSRHFLLNNMVTHRLPMHPQIGEVVGNFASLYPLEVDWRHRESFAQRALRLQEQVMSDLDHVYWSGVKVLQALNQVRRTPGRAVCPFVVGSGLFMGELDRPVVSHLETPQVLLDNQFWQQGDGSLWIVWDLIEEMFPAGLVDAMAAALRTAIELLAGKDQAWEREHLDLLPAAQRERRDRVNHSDSVVPAGLLHDALTGWAAERPDHPAVVGPDGTVSYRGLAERATAVAGQLVESGVREGDMVAVVMTRSVAQVAAVYGVLAAGGSYLPIDPGWPADRIRYLLEQAGVRAALTASDGRSAIADLTDRPVIAADRPPTATDSPAPRVVRRTSTDTAYVIYTSGSSGAPKGAVLDHRGPLNTVLDVNRRFDVDADAIVFGVSSLCFDLSVYDIFGTCAAGGTLVLPPGSGTDPAAWVEHVIAHGVTVWNSVPAIMQLFVEAALSAGRTLPRLRTVLLSGDWVPVSLPDQIRQVAPSARVVSLGGATEASIWSIHHPVDEVDPSWASIPYGRPLSHQPWRVVDAFTRDLPDWVTGELLVGGVGVARGYLGDPDRTAAAFCTDPTTGMRYYRTGDLGRYLPNGEIEFLGRADLQVKIQGFRVEPGEVEHVLAAHCEVRQAAVIARRVGSAQQLVAYVVAEQGCAPEPAGLLAHLAGLLPGYLVPSVVTVLDDLPLSANGKVDRAALAGLAPLAETARRPHTGPRTATEAALAQIWCGLLDLESVSVHDDFFDLGGQSFVALRALNLIRQRLGAVVPLGALLERRTVAGLAEFVDAGQVGWSPLVRLPGRDVGEPWFLVHPAGGDVLCYRELAEHLDGPCHAFQAPGPAVGRAPLRAIDAFVDSYLDALVKIRPHGPYRLGGWSSGSAIALELAHRLEQRGETVERLAVIDAPAPGVPFVPDDATLLLWFVEDLGLGFDPASVDIEERRRLAALPAAEQLDRALAIARQRLGRDLGVGPADLAATWAVFRGVVVACHAYSAPVVSADLVLLRAGRGRVSEFPEYGASPAGHWGWAARTTGRITEQVLDADHRGVLTGPYVRAVANALTAPRPVDR
ncbi:amino acid adenylation domain-containing protein [Micromonospora sp. NPDC005215]|uniref:non-ribosomal peptide synthetase n=1 Tax=Micromonospora sp. NPDC005215 TaxID=3157024 RepID=UPI0033AF71C8